MNINSKTIILILILSCTILSGCAPSPEEIQLAVNQTEMSWTPIPSNTPFPTYTPFYTYTPFPTYTNVPTVAIEITRIVMVTPTHTATPLYTPTITSTPTVTPTRTPTPNVAQTATASAWARLISPKGDGFYLINIDIAPGIWRSTGTEDGCYWAVTDRYGNIIDNHYGMSGGTAYIPPTGYQVEFDDCGIWEYLGE
jgi:hypothetical protein